jgi:hypothetical protein
MSLLLVGCIYLYTGLWLECICISCIPMPFTTMTEDEAIIKLATIIKPTRLPAATDNDLASMTTNHPTGNFYDDGEELQILFMEKAVPFPCFG